MTRMIVALDGPAGAGKSTVCRLLAKELGFTYLDTGAMYRAIAWALLQQGFQPEDEPKLQQILATLPLRFSIENGELIVFYRETGLNDELRQPEITIEASRISRIEPVRAFLTEWQRKLAEKGNVVAEGRDMSTVVFPDAAVKVFLTADLATRTQRRFAEYQAKGISIDYPALLAQIRERDEADQERALAPLRPAHGALMLDTSGLNIAEVVKQLSDLVQERRSGVN
ncbi:MAG: (d)CMP kinase [Syntrophobacteraceae bacterium]